MSGRIDFAAVRTEVERALGFRLATFERLKAGSSPNFKAVRASDGFPFLVKLLPPNRQWAFDRLVAHISETAGSGTVARVFPEAPAQVADCRMICLEWCEGEVKMPHELTREEWTALLAFYRGFLPVLQRTTRHARPWPLVEWRERVLSTRGLSSAWARRYVARELPVETVTFRPAELQVIFGDFHHGNLLFRDGRIHRVLDLEAFRTGYPTEDVVRYLTCAYDHLRACALFHRAEYVAAFVEAMKTLPYPPSAWRTALAGVILARLQDLVDRPRNPFVSLNVHFRLRFYRLLWYNIRP